MNERYDSSSAALLNPGLSDTLFQFDRSHSHSQLAAECARLAYIRFEDGDAERHRLASALSLAGLQLAQTFSVDNSHSHGFAAVLPSALTILAFRGTEVSQITDIATDLRASLTLWSQGGKVHLGFAAAASQLLPVFSSWWDSHATPRLILAGHSLGAAIATLFASVYRQAELITIGSPRVGDQDFAAACAGQAICRYVDCCDLVARVPPETPDFPLYVHLPGERYIDKDGGIHDAPGFDIAADQAAAREEYLLQRAWKIGAVPLRDLADHAPINYLTALFP